MTNLRFMIYLLSAGLIAGAAACGPSAAPDQQNNNTNTNQGGTCSADEDGDRICDIYEDRAGSRDTDQDGTPDYLDLDSDGDTLTDSVEYGWDAVGHEPLDTDGDGIPDFQDTDSDNNGLPDQVDGVADFDQDGRGNYADMDDDGDGIPDASEMDGQPYAPPDTDQDGMPDYQDEDSDGDTILDIQEGAGWAPDTDSDTLPDYRDLDSDNDGIPDAIEAGDEDLDTPPVDTDGDQIPDYRDPDSDNDGLPDGQEDVNHNGVVDPGESDPHQTDTDGDGVTDLIEVAAGTDPQDGADNPQANGDFYFVVPYQEPTEPLQDTLEFRTSVQFADIYFLMDETGSMGDEFNALGSGIPNIISELTCANSHTPCVLDSDCGSDQICFGGECVQDPLQGDGCVPDLWTGFGRFNDCNTYRNQVPLQPDPSTTAAAIGGTGPGGSESVLQSATCVADSSHCSNNNQCSSDPSNPNPIGCPGFRSDAVRILIHITDAGNQAGGSCGNIASPSIVAQILDGAGIKYVGLWGTSDNGGSPCGSAQDCLDQIGSASSSVDPQGNPFVYQALDSAVVNATKQGVLELVRGVPLNVTIDAQDLPGDDGDAMPFVDFLEVNVSGQGNCTNVTPTADTNGDSHDDSFPSLLGGTPVCWDVHPIGQNEIVPATEFPQVFKARLTVYGDGSPLDQRDVYFLVPPVIDTGIIPD